MTTGSLSRNKPVRDRRSAAWATLRAVEVADAALIAGHRAHMYLEAGFDLKAVEAMGADSEVWLARALMIRSYSGFIAVAGGRPVGGIGMLVQPWPPHPQHPLDTRRGYILNLYVDPEHRKGGLGADLLAAAEDWLRTEGVAFACLHPTERAQALYLRSGWSGTGELAKKL